MSFRQPRVLPWELIIGSALDWVFPPRCMVCNRVDTWLCDGCADQLPWITGPTCARCGLPIRQGILCTRCATTPPRLEGIHSALWFQDPLRQAIHRLKYRHGWKMAQPLGKLMARYWQNTALAVDLIVPVPLYPTRLLQRGYNQAALLAGEVGRQMGLPIDESALRRVRKTATQMRLKAAERQQNVQGAFHCPNGQVWERRILLVDDVCTTGATLEACADALRAAGAHSVRALTLARAP